MIIDLTRPFSQTQPFNGECMYSVEPEAIPLESLNTRYTGNVYHVRMHSMCSTYIDFPGHIRETDDGRTAETQDIAAFCDVPSRVVHLSRKSGSGAVSGAELSATAKGCIKTPCLVVNALGGLDALDIEERTVWLDDSAVDWIIATGCRILVSDIFESTRLEGVFLKLFKAGVSTVCLPVKLSQLSETECLSIIFNPIPGMTQVPCRLLCRRP